MPLTQDRKSEIVLDLLKELMSEMKGVAGSKLKPVSAEVKTVSAEPIEEEKDEPLIVEAVPLEKHMEAEREEGEEEPDIEEYDGSDLEDVLDKASEDEPKSAASRRMAKLAASNKR
jgi:hypothetical protein